MATRELRINRQIRAHQVLVIDENGVQRGTMSVPEACRLAEESGLDLVEVSPNANPPVCKILDFGRYRYEMEKKSREAKKNQTVVKIKEIRMQPKIEKHDLETKSKAIAEFLGEGRRRTDLLRWNKFVEENWWDHTATGNANLKLFPIPNDAISGNPLIEPNPGYGQ